MKNNFMTVIIAAAFTVMFAFTVHAQETITTEEVQMTFGQGDTYADIIKNDHQVITQYFSQLTDPAQKDKRESKFEEFKKGLEKHMKAEEEHLYPRLDKDKEHKATAVKAQDEHAAAKAQLEKIDPKSDDEIFIAQMEVLRNMIDTHVQFEESQLLMEADQVIPAEEQQKVTDDFKKVYE